MKKILYTIPIFLSIIALQAKAVCPVCIILVGAGVGLSQYFGIDDSITGLWIGGLTIAMIIWTIYFFDKKNWYCKNNINRNIVIIISYYLLILWPLYSKNLIGHPLNKLWGADKLLLGIIIGSVFLPLTNWLYDYLRRKNNNHAYFPFQKVIMPITVLIIFSLIFYFINK